MKTRKSIVVVALLVFATTGSRAADQPIREYPVPDGSHPHDVAPAVARRVWADSKSRVWVSEWNSGQVSVHDPKTNQWKQWRLPGKNPQTYAVFVDDKDMVWLSDFGGDAIVRFDPGTEQFTTFKLPTSGAKVRQTLGRLGEVWLPESATDKLAVIRVP